MRNYKIAGSGHQGIIIYPAIKPHFPNRSNYVTKLGVYDILANEKKIYDNLPNEFNNIMYNKACWLDKFDRNKNARVYNIIKHRNREYTAALTIQLYKGKTIQELCKKFKRKQDLYKCILLLTSFCDKLYILNNTYGVFHRDITDQNILVDLKGNSIKLIDFATASFINKKVQVVPIYNGDLIRLFSIINDIIHKHINPHVKPFTCAKDITVFINNLKK